MKISFDPAKSEANRLKRGIGFESALAFDWMSALVVEDTRRDYGERRFRAMGRIGSRLHVLVFTPRIGKLHVISLRKANPREVISHEQASQA